MKSWRKNLDQIGQSIGAWLVLTFVTAIVVTFLGSGVYIAYRVLLYIVEVF